MGEIADDLMTRRLRRQPLFDDTFFNKPTGLRRRKKRSHTEEARTEELSFPFLISSIEPDLQKKSFLRMSKQRAEPTDASKRAALKTAGLPSGQKKGQALNAASAAMVQQQAEGDGARPSTRGRTVPLREQRPQRGARASGAPQRRR